MYEITMQDTDAVGGGIWGWLGAQIGTRLAEYALREAWAGNVDYASIAESQGTYYNTVGA